MSLGVAGDVVDLLPKDAMMQYPTRHFLVAAMFVLAFIVPGLAQERGTPEQAQSLCERALLHMKEVGPAKAIRDFNDPEGGYVDHDLFVIVYDPNGTIMTGIPALIGKDAHNLTDVTGKEFGKAIIDAAHEKYGSWVEYHMTNRTTKKIEVKSSYVRRFDDYVVFVGAYK
jgi:cytochrome c